MSPRNRAESGLRRRLASSLSRNSAQSASCAGLVAAAVVAGAVVGVAAVSLVVAAQPDRAMARRGRVAN